MVAKSALDNIVGNLWQQRQESSGSSVGNQVCKLTRISPFFRHSELMRKYSFAAKCQHFYDFLMTTSEIMTKVSEIILFGIYRQCPTSKFRNKTGNNIQNPVKRKELIS